MNARNIDELLKFIMRNSRPLKSTTSVDYIAGTFAPHVPGSVPFTCERCKRTVYLSDGVQMKKKYPGTPVVCLECLVKEVE
jgi:hypothetical protein